MLEFLSGAARLLTQSCFCGSLGLLGEYIAAEQSFLGWVVLLLHGLV